MSTQRTCPACARCARTAFPRRPARLCTPSLLAGLVAVICLSGCGGSASRTRQISAVGLTDMDGYVEVVARQRVREQNSKVGAGKMRSRETILEQNLRLEVDGYTYHPNLLDFTLGGLFGLVQEDFKDTSGDEERTSSDTGTVFEFDFDAQFLKKKAFPLTVFAHRHRSLTPRPFLPSLETINTEYGVLWQYVDDKIPTRFQFRDSDTRLDPLYGLEETGEKGRQQNRLFRFDTGYIFSDRSALSLVYQHESVKEEPFDIDYDASEATLAHDLHFGFGNRSRLESELNYLSRKGTLNLDRLRWRETLRLRHSDSLRSLFRLEVLDRDRGSRSRKLPSIEERSILFSAMLEHRLYESLTSQVRGFVQRQRFKPGLDIDRFGGEIGFDYRKKNPWGVLYANYRVRMEQADHTGEVQPIEIIDEAHIFEGFEPITLNNPRIRPGSIVIRGNDRVTLYQPERDYTVHRIGNRVEIRRVVTGWIPEQERIYIDYIYSLGGSFELDTLSQNFGIRQDFDIGFVPYYRFEWQDQTVSPVTVAEIIPEDITAHIVGLEFQKRWLRLTAEYEDRESTIDSLARTRLGASLHHRFKSGATGSFHAHWSDTDHYTPLKRKVRLTTLQGQYRHPITAHLDVEGSLLYRISEDSLSGDDDGIDLSLSVDWSIRKVSVKVTLDLNQYEDDFARNESSAMYVQVRRSF